MNLETIASQYGIFAAMFIGSLIFFWKYVQKHDMERKKDAEHLTTRLVATETYVRDTLVAILVETRVELSNSTRVNALAISRLERMETKYRPSAEDERKTA